MDMNDQAHPVLIMLAALLMAAVTVTYIADRSLDPARYELSVAPGAAFHPPS
jgi:hypothetical protein